MYSVEYRVRHHQFGWRWMAAKGVPVVSINGDIREWVGMNIDIDDQRRSEERMQFIIDELSHRTKNLLAVIHAMSRQAAKHGNTSGAPLHEHVRAQLLPFIDADNPRVTVSGPPVMLTPEGTQALGFAFHELTTNAVKHGALTLVGGDIEIAWQVKSAGDRQMFSLRWSERCAGTPRRANGAGFGTMILQRVVPSSLSGVSRYLFEGESIIWEIETPLEQVVSATALPLHPRAPEPALDHVSTSA
jgi:two-component sensor histidine kinase